MKILAIDASGLTASVAVFSEDKMLGEFTLNSKMNHSITLLPLIDKLLKSLEIEKKEIDYIAISKGPGSFTGLRIGSATAKGISFSLNKPIVAVPTLDSMCFNIAGIEPDALICPIMNARRNQTYSGIYEMKYEKERDRYSLNILKENGAYQIEEILYALKKIGKKVIFLGDGIYVFKDIIEETFGKGVLEYAFAPLHLRMQRASSVGYLAIEYIEKGILEDAYTHHPTYLRETQAERERKKKLNGD